MQRTAVTLAGFLALLACDGHDVHDHPRAISSAELYRLHCAGCHLEDGSGVFLRGAPPLSQTALSYAELVDRILGHAREGQTRMPVFATMPRGEAERIAVHVRQKLVAR